MNSSQMKAQMLALQGYSTTHDLLVAGCVASDSDIYITHLQLCHGVDFMYCTQSVCMQHQGWQHIAVTVLCWCLAGSQAQHVTNKIMSNRQTSCKPVVNWSKVSAACHAQNQRSQPSYQTEGSLRCAVPQNARSQSFVLTG